MSTIYSASAEPGQREASVTVGPAETPAPAAPRPWWQRVPAPVFITGYGVVLVAAIVLGVALTSYSSSTERESIELEQPRRPFNPAPADAEYVAASVRPWLIENVELGATKTGVALRGEVASAAAPEEVAGHVSRLLDQNCLDSMTLSTTGPRVNFWGFCFSTIPPETIQPLTEYASEEGAESIAFYNFASRSNRHEAALNWMDAGSKDSLDTLVRSWRALAIPPEVDLIVLTAYGDEEVVVMEKDRKKGNTIKRSPAGEAFREEWGL